MKALSPYSNIRVPRPNPVIEALRISNFPLSFMDDIQAPVIGTKGTVIGVDDIGSIMVSWDTRSSLSVVYGEDLCRRIDDDR